MTKLKASGVDITFKDLTYTVPIPKSKEKKDVLKSVSGVFKSGQLTAIMGPSGAGKSSLLNILTGFTKNGVTGSINFGERGKSKKICSYILQDDQFFPWFTVEESMLLAATLKISNKSMTLKEKQLMIEHILDILSLSNTKQTRCSNLSGGQKKRLSIALELIDNPPVLFLDEPTTGLDSSASVDTVKLLHSLSEAGRTIVCTIHQPAATVYLMFEQIYVLSQGYCVYKGSPLNTIPFLSSFNLQCPQYHNPADYLLEVTTGDYGDYTLAMSETAKKESWLYDSKENVPVYNLNEYQRDAAQNEQTKPLFAPPEWIQLWVLIGRCHIQFYRDWTVTHLKLALHVICAVLIGLLFGDCGTNADKAISNAGLYIIIIVYLWYTTMMPGVLRFPAEISTIKKETFNNWYKLRTYYMATLITSTPIHIIFSTTFTTILYVMTDQPFELERYVKFTLVTIMLTIAADGFGILLGTVVDPVNGTFLGAILTCFMLLFAGFLILFEHMPFVLKGVSYISAHRYGLESLVLSTYANNRADMECPEGVMYCHLRSAKLILNSLGMTNGDYGFNVSMILLQITLFKGLAYFTLRRALRNA